MPAIREAEYPLARLAVLQPDPPLSVLLLQSQLYGEQGQQAKLAEVFAASVRKAGVESARLTTPERGNAPRNFGLGNPRGPVTRRSRSTGCDRPWPSWNGRAGPTTPRARRPWFGRPRNWSCWRRRLIRSSQRRPPPW